MAAMVTWYHMTTCDDHVVMVITWSSHDPFVNVLAAALRNGLHRHCDLWYFVNGISMLRWGCFSMISLHLTPNATYTLPSKY